MVAIAPRQIEAENDVFWPANHRQEHVFIEAGVLLKHDRSGDCFAPAWAHKLYDALPGDRNLEVRWLRLANENEQLRAALLALAAMCTRGFWFVERAKHLLQESGGAHD